MCIRDRIGVIPIDAIYTPVKRVSYKVENTRVGQRTDYEKLTIDLKTDGTIHPEIALKEASRILIQHLMLITDENITFNDATSREDSIVDEHILHMRKLLKTSLEDLDLSVRAYNCLKAAKIKMCIRDSRKGLPVRGQSTKTNARTRKGKKKTVANKKKATK